MTKEQVLAAVASEGLALVRSRCKSGYKNVTKAGSAAKPFKMTMRHKHTHFHLGVYATLEEAALAYSRAVGPEQSREEAAAYEQRHGFFSTGTRHPEPQQLCQFDDCVSYKYVGVFCKAHHRIVQEICRDNNSAFNPAIAPPPVKDKHLTVDKCAPSPRRQREHSLRSSKLGNHLPGRSLARVSCSLSHSVHTSRCLERVAKSESTEMSQRLKLLDLTDDALSHVVRCVLPPSEDFEMADSVKALSAFRASCKRIWNLTNNAMDNYWRDLCKAGWAFKQRPCKGVTLYHLYVNNGQYAPPSLEHYTWKETFELSMRYLTPYVDEEYRREKVHLHCAMDQIRTLGWDWKLQIADSLRDALDAASKLPGGVEAVMAELLTGLVPQEHGAEVVQRIQSSPIGPWAGDARLKEILGMLVGSDERKAALDEVPDLLKGGAHFTYEEKRPPIPNVLELAVVENNEDLAELACSC